MAEKKNIHTLLLASFFLFIFVLYLSFLTDNTNIKKNSIEYFILVPSVIKELPVEQWGKVIRYHHNEVDGTTSQMDGVILTVKQYPDKIVETVKNYFISKKFSVIEKKTQGVDLKKDKQHVSVYYHYDEETDFYKFDIMFY